MSEPAASTDPPLYPPTVTPPAEIRSLVHYLARFVTERTLTINTSAVGGNASLLAME